MLGAQRMSLAIATSIAVLAAGPAPVGAAVYYGRQDALQAAFPDADEIESQRFFLTEAQRKQVEEVAKAPLEDRMVTVYVGKKGDEVLGYAFLETHEVRTLPETLLIVVAPDATVSKILLAAFYEPPEYVPSQRWLDQFHGESLSHDVRVNRDIKGIAGSTLTAHAVTGGVRRVLALYEILLRDEPAAE